MGSNIDPEDNVREALRRLDQEGRIVAVSTFYRTAALGVRPQPDYYNGVVEIEVDIDAASLKHSILRRIEDALGRRRTADAYAPRTIDLDLLVYGDSPLFVDGRPVPDPDALARPFVAVPLAELAPGLTLPGSERRITDVAARTAGYPMVPLPGYTRQLIEVPRSRRPEPTTEEARQ
ncbi:2-amino-4-hydroxy-6-hydroxymethyldihydropteridine diphosphokinase [Sorangium sp. KYC3313]|uniref:2-amino-4-hydroxy-6- hydroxymethyldihydropteridine diphosphokinase n=1 Tax=Sorangium sp. KYC3313 TaxID=3449740 RepID=UPI003F8B0B57